MTEDRQLDMFRDYADLVPVTSVEATAALIEESEVDHQTTPRPIVSEEIDSLVMLAEPEAAVETDVQNRVIVAVDEDKPRVRRLGPAPRPLANGKVISDRRDVDFIQTPIDDLIPKNLLLVGTYDNRASMLCFVTQYVGNEDIQVQAVQPVGGKVATMIFDTESGAILRAYVGGNELENEAIINSGLRIRATGPVLEETFRTLGYARAMRAYKAQMPPLAAGSELEAMEIVATMAPGMR